MRDMLAPLGVTRIQVDPGLIAASLAGLGAGMISAPRVELPANGTARCPACGQHAAHPGGTADGGRSAGALNALVRVQLRAGVHPDCFEARLGTEAGVVQAWRLAGDSDFEVRSVLPEPRRPGRRGGAAP